MKKYKKQEQLIYGIVGLGRFGYSLAIDLASKGAEIMVLDHDEEKVKAIREYTENAFIVSNLEKNTLIQTGIGNCDVVIVCIGGTIDVSILTTLNLVSMGVKKVIAKATTFEHGEVLEKLGAEVVYPERDMAIRLANRLEANTMLDYIQLSEQINISKIIVPQSMVGKSIIENNIRQKFGLNIIAIESQGKVIDQISPNYQFKKGDILFLAGSKEGLFELSNYKNS